MPRKSAEERAGAAWRAGAPPEPPRYLSRAAKVVWREIVFSRPPDHFPHSALPVLEIFCGACIASRAIGAQLHKDPLNRKMLASFVDIAKLKMSCATKLRLLPTAPRDHGITSERGGAGARDKLLGGQARRPN